MKRTFVRFFLSLLLFDSVISFISLNFKWFEIKLIF